MQNQSLRELSPADTTVFIETLKHRFEQNHRRHPDINWIDVQKKIEANPEKLWTLHEMERTGGEPDVTGFDKKTGEYSFVDCSPETPEGRRNVCYDRKGQISREKKGIHPAGNVQDMAAEMGIEILSEEDYQALQKLGDFDTKTSSWIQTPEKILKLGGAFFADKRFDHVFIYHNTAPSFYSARGFRGVVKI